MAEPSDKPADEPASKRNTLGTIALMAPLFGILAAALWFAARAWMMADGIPMATSGYVAMTLGVFFSLAVGFGLMTLLFYSSRHGYDEPVRPEHDRD